MQTKRTLLEILTTPISDELDLIDALTLVIVGYPDAATSDKILDALRELDTLANAPAPAVDVNAELLAALKGVICVADRKTVEFDAARAAIANAEASQQLAQPRRELTNQEKAWAQELEPEAVAALIAAGEAQALTAREIMERETA